MTEQEITALMRKRAARDGELTNFIGAGAYEHHIPAAVWEITTRGEFYSAYTPYQAEASQGTLQLIYEYQSMMTALTGMDVSNASLYDGASALAEACLMAVRANRKSSSRRILVAGAVNPVYSKVTKAITGGQALRLERLPYSEELGRTDPERWQEFAGEDITAVVIPQPNFFGQLEDVDELCDWAHANGALVIAVVNPHGPGHSEAPGQLGRSRRRYRLWRGPAAWRAALFRRALLRLHVLPPGACPADAGPRGWAHRRPGRSTRFHADAAGT